MSAIRVRALIRGRVQGVWFRESTRKRAEALGIGGWVRNLSDGGVEALFEGEEERVREAIAFVREGPPLARVTGVSLDEEIVHEPGEQGFRIR